MAAAPESSRARVLLAVVVLALATAGTSVGVVMLALGAHAAVGLTAVAAVGASLLVGWAARGELRPGGRGGGRASYFAAAFASVALAKAPDVVQLDGLALVAGFLAVCTTVVAQRQL